MAYRNKERQKEYAAKHYQLNKERMKNKAAKNNKEAAIRNMEYIKGYLSNYPCIDCGNNNIIVLEFDHIRGTKLYNVSEMCRAAYSLETIQKEIDKCEVRCANCHRIVTHTRRLKNKDLDF